MSHDRNCDPVTTNKRTFAQVAKGKKTKEKMITPKQSHNINGLNGNTVDHDMHEAQTSADVIYDFNEMFKTEEKFTNPWQQSLGEDENKFSNKTEESFQRQRTT